MKEDKEKSVHQLSQLLFSFSMESHRTPHVSKLPKRRTE